MKYGEILRVGREKKSLTQQSLAKMLNVSDKTISAWEANRREPNIETFLKLIYILDLHHNFFPAQFDTNKNSLLLPQGACKKRSSPVETDAKIKRLEERVALLEDAR